SLLPIINRSDYRSDADLAQGRAMDSKPQQVPALRQFLTETVARLLKMELVEVDIETELANYGFDSVLISEFVSETNRAYGLDLLTATLMEYKTIRELAEFLASRLPEEPVSTPSAAPVTTTLTEARNSQVLAADDSKANGPVCSDTDI